MKIEAGNAWTRLVEGTAPEREWLEALISVEETQYRPGQWGPVHFEARRSLMNWTRREFPSGLVRRVMLGNRRRAEPFPMELVDARGAAPCRPDAGVDLAWLRDYQRGAVQALLARGRGVVKAPTASGKTEVGVGVVAALPTRWIFAVHRADLMHQTAERYTRRTGDRDVGMIGDGVHQPGGRLTVATFQTLHAMLRDRRDLAAKRLVEGFGGLLVDEVHAQAADSFFDVSQACSGAYFRVGLSATPFDRGDWESLRVEGALGPLVHEIATDTLVELGLLARPTIRMIPCPQTWPRDEGADWRRVYERLVVESDARNALVVHMAVRAAKPALVFVDRIPHGKALERSLRAAGLGVGFVHGAHWTEARRAEIRRLVQGKQDVLICSGVFQEGIDIPELASVVVAGGKASVVATLQRIGRGMRTSAGKSTFEVWDVLDRGQRWLERHATERRETYEREGHAVLTDWPKEGP